MGFFFFFFFCFSLWILWFYHFHFFSWGSIKFLQQNFNQSETRVGGLQLSVELHECFISWFFKLTNHMILIFSVAAFWMAQSERIQCQKHASSFGGARPLFRSMRMLLYMVIVSQRSAHAHSLCNAGTTKNVLHMLLIQLTLALFWIAASFLRKISLNFRIQD